MVGGVVVSKQAGYIRVLFGERPVTVYTVRPSEGIDTIGYGSPNLAQERDTVEMRFRCKIGLIRFDRVYGRAYEITGMTSL